MINIVKNKNHPLKTFGLYSLTNSRWVSKNNINRRIYPASITKLLTTLITLDNCKLNEIVKPTEFINAPQLRADLQLGKKYSIETLLRALLVRSANDVANLLQTYIENKTKTNWPLLTSEYCKKLKMVNSSFTNANGLHNNDHYTTIQDLLLLGKKAYQNQTVLNILKMPTCKIVTSHGRKSVLYNNTNLFLNKNGVIAGKTGYTPKAGQCFLFYFRKNKSIYIGIFADTDKEKFKQNVNKLIDLAV